MRAGRIFRFTYIASLTCQVLLVSCSQDKLQQDSCAGYEDWSNSVYVLPYPAGTTYSVLQGNCTNPNTPGASHFRMDRYSYDFLMDIGTYITAARSGEVVFVREEFTDQDKGLDQGNVVVILHNDSTYAAYGHLTNQGVFPELGDNVSVGDTLGLSGNSGLSSIPHLHFHVSPCLDQAICGTLPITFRNTQPNPNGLEVGGSYSAL